jgi:hypothetical protein
MRAAMTARPQDLELPATISIFQQKSRIGLGGRFLTDKSLVWREIGKSGTGSQFTENAVRTKPPGGGR